jgi:hypothetical protein
MIPALRSEVGETLEQLHAAVFKLNQRGYLSNPWLGDEVSSEVAVHYTQRAMDRPDSSYQALTQYRDELTRVHETLQHMEDHYRRTEGDNAALWGLRA